MTSPAPLVSIRPVVPADFTHETRFAVDTYLKDYRCVSGMNDRAGPVFAVESAGFHPVSDGGIESTAGLLRNEKSEPHRFKKANYHLPFSRHRGRSAQ